jgi:hypothetical protein
VTSAVTTRVSTRVTSTLRSSGVEETAAELQAATPKMSAHTNKQLIKDFNASARS